MKCPKCKDVKMYHDFDRQRDECPQCNHVIKADPEECSCGHTCRCPEIAELKAEVEHLEKCDKNQIDTIGTYLKKVAELKAEAYKLESKLRKWYHKSRMWFDGESWVELHSAAQVELKREEAGKKLKESEAVVKVLAGWVAENTMPFVTVEGNIEKAKLEAARQEAKTKEGVTRNGADLKRRKEQVYGPSHICYCGVSVGSCQCPKEES